MLRAKRRLAGPRYERSSAGVAERTLDFAHRPWCEGQASGWVLVGRWHEGSAKGDRYRLATMEATWATLKREIRDIHGDWETMTRSQLRTVLFDYIETFYNRRRHQARLGH